MKKLLILVVFVICLGIVLSGAGLASDLRKLTGGSGGGDDDPITASEYLRGYKEYASTDFSSFDEAAWHLGPKTMHTMDTSSGYLKVTCTGYQSGEDAMFYSSTYKTGYGSDVAFDLCLKRTETQCLISRFNIKVANDAGEMKDASILRIKADGSVLLSTVDDDGNGAEILVTTLSSNVYRRITCGIDLDTKTADVFVDGKLIVEDAPIAVAEGYTNIVRLFYLYIAPTRSNAENSAALILDNIKVYTDPDFKQPAD